MAFRKVDQAVPNFPALEKRILQFWEDRDVFRRSLAEAVDRPDFVFYEGPPTANGLPHNGHVLTRVIKDLYPRYKTMRGYRVERRAGWDTHGLPVEVEVEKGLRISGKAAIVDYGVDRFNRKCLESVFRYTEEWEHLTKRIGFWVDLNEAYVTFHKSYVESVWWALSELFSKGLLYQGHKVVWWWAQGGTALSSGEVGSSYKTVDDPSIYVRFPLVGEEASLLVWTTTPWTLPSNVYVGVHGEFDYVYAQDEETSEVLVLAEALVPTIAEKTGAKYKIIKKIKGKELFDREYRPPFDVFAKELPEDDKRYWRIVAGDRSRTQVPDWFVTLDAGTGLVHMAPAFGEDDWKAWQKEWNKDESIELFCCVRPDGTFDEKLSFLDLEGTWVKDGDKAIIRHLDSIGLLLHRENYRHEYPFCPRADNDPLIQYARSAWFIKTTSQIDRVLENNQAVQWMPEHIKNGRMGDFLEGNVDWALSRERFWGTPLNIWVCEDCGHMHSPASCKEIEELNPDAFADFYKAKEEDPTLADHLQVHKPWIDQVTLPCGQCSGTMRRVPEVIDCWFDSGCMPFAQVGYPHIAGSKEAFERSFPANFISEAVDQTRGWFYSLMMVSNLLFESLQQPHPYQRCIVLGHVLDKEGYKESKSKGNYTPPEVILDAVKMSFAVVGADSPQVPKAKAKGPKEPKAGTAWVGPEDLDGLDMNEGSEITLTAAEQSIKVKLKPFKGLPRRVLFLSESDRQKLAVEPVENKVMAREVPRLEAKYRVLASAEGIPAPGADAFRWFFYASNPPWNSTRHSLGNVRGAQKELPVKLHNVFAFFITYANIDQFDPVADEKYKRPASERALLDKWILSELEKTKLEVVEHMDAFRSYEATQQLSALVDGLSNWYVRRSRDRFWSPGREQDKLDAYWTLYQCLLDLTLLLGPFIPFMTEEMYQILVVEPYGSGPPDSVHLRAYPSGDADMVDQALSQDMAEVRSLVSLGLQVRASHKIKVRQPLAAAEVVLSNPSRKDALAVYEEVIKDELNVKQVNFLARADELVTYKVKPNFQRLGKRVGQHMKATQKAITSADPEQLLKTLERDGEVVFTFGEQHVVITAEDVIPLVEAKDGFAAATAPVGVIVLKIELDKALIEEGWVREVLSKIQAQRKALDLDYAARINLTLCGHQDLMTACQHSESLIMQECLASQISYDALEDKPRFTIDGRELLIDIQVS